MRCSHWPHLALVTMSCMLVGACTSTTYEMRAASAGFGETSGVVDLYDDGKRQLAERRFGLAVQRFRQALAADRRSVDVLNGLAVAYAALGRTQLAEVYLQRALELRHDDVATLNNYGRLLLEQGHLQKARPMLDLAVRLASGPDHAIVHANRTLLDPPERSLANAPPPLPPVRLERAAAAIFHLRTGSLLRHPAAPAATSPDSLPPAPATELAPFVVVANGAGVNGLAATWRRQLIEAGVRVDTIANATTFGNAMTEIRFHPLFASEAHAIAALLPTSTRLIADATATGDIYVALGLDSLETIGEPA
jgi:hypothetical protein